MFTTNWDVWMNKTTKVIRGTGLDKEFKTEGEKNFEVRIDLSKRVWRIGSLPDYQDVVELDDPNWIDANGSYHFAIYMRVNGESVIINHISEVDAFDNQM